MRGRLLPPHLQRAYKLTLPLTIGDPTSELPTRARLPTWQEKPGAVGSSRPDVSFSYHCKERKR
jgi:hypothetical protein